MAVRKEEIIALLWQCLDLCCVLKYTQIGFCVAFIQLQKASSSTATAADHKSSSFCGTASQAEQHNGTAALYDQAVLCELGGYCMHPKWHPIP